VHDMSRRGHPVLFSIVDASKLVCNFYTCFV
jgi:hypothetical protein